MLRAELQPSAEDLERKIDPYPLPAYIPFDTPMAAEGLKAIRELPSDENPLLGEPYPTLSRSILGSGGWIATTVRADGQFSFVALAQQVGKNLTRKTWLALLRFARYLVSTKHLRLYLRADGPGGPATGCSPPTRRLSMKSTGEASVDTWAITKVAAHSPGLASCRVSSRTPQGGPSSSPRRAA